MKKRQIFLAIPAKAISGGFAPDILPILTATTTDTRLRGHKFHGWHRFLATDCLARLRFAQPQPKSSFCKIVS